MLTLSQIEERKNGIGGSDMPIILGLSKYKTAYQLYLEKLGIIESSYDETPVQYWGNRLESIVRDEFASRHNIEIETPDTITHPMFDYMKGNLDGFIPEWNAVLEIKCSSSYMSNEWGEDGSDMIPMSYLVQVAHYCAVTNADKAYIAVLIGGNDYREFMYKRDLILESTLIDAAKDFWDGMQDEVAPSSQAMTDVRLMYPTHSNGKSIIASADMETEILNMVKLRKKMKDLSEEEDKLKQVVATHMQDAECLTDANGKTLVTFKTNKKGSRVFLLKSED